MSDKFIKKVCNLLMVILSIFLLCTGCSGAKSTLKSSQKTPNPDETWKSPIFDFNNYTSLSVPTVKIPIQNQHEDPARYAALYVLRRLSRHDDHAIQIPKSVPDTVQIATVPGIDLSLKVLVVFNKKDTGSKRFLMKIYPYSRKWIMTEIGVQYR